MGGEVIFKNINEIFSSTLVFAEWEMVLKVYQEIDEENSVEYLAWMH